MNKNYFHLIIVILLSLGNISNSFGDVQSSNEDNLQFIVIGDWGTPRSNGQKLVAAQLDKLAAATSIDFIISTGDNFYMKGVKSVEDPLWKNAFEEIYSLPALKNIPWYVSLGNHDYMGDFRAQIEYGESHANWILPQNYYSKDFNIGTQASVRFLFLDTVPFFKEYRVRPNVYHHIEAQDSAEQLRWMNTALKESDATWKIAVGHHPVYSAGPHGDSEELKKVLPQMFEQQKVHAYFAGHDHHLEHYRSMEATHYFISGAGSRPRKISKRRHSEFAVKSLGFAHVILDKMCMQVRFINEEGTELYRSNTSSIIGNQCD
ncbi:MAG: tartrate-resistant acid phosphatase type 5 [Gammaproteobacteria bacterium]|jgi:tartrate-resistant acid phosphatase type 5